MRALWILFPCVVASCVDIAGVRGIEEPEPRDDTAALFRPSFEAGVPDVVDRGDADDEPDAWVGLGTVRTAPGAEILALRAQPGRLYWIERLPGSAQVLRCATPLCATPVAIVSSRDRISNLEVDGTSVFVLDDGGLRRHDADGGPSSTLATSSGMRGPIGIDGSYVFLTRYGDFVKCERAGCAGGFATVSRETGAHVAITIAGAHAYWVDTLHVHRCAIASCYPATLAYGEQIADLVLGAGAIYFSDEYYGTVSSYPLDGGRVTTLASHQTRPSKLALDATHVYWTARDAVMRCALPACAGGPATVAAEAATDLALEGEHVFYVAGTSIKRLPK
jgi:hypothetical protein